MSDEDIFYDEKLELLDFSEVVDPENDITMGDYVGGLRLLKDKRGHSGPFTPDEVALAITEFVVNEALENLKEKGIIQSYMNRNGEMVYELVDGMKEALEDEDV